MPSLEEIDLSVMAVVDDGYGRMGLMFIGTTNTLEGAVALAECDAIRNGYGGEYQAHSQDEPILISVRKVAGELHGFVTHNPLDSSTTDEAAMAAL
jgi:hypothetical protein